MKDSDDIVEKGLTFRSSCGKKPNRKRARKFKENVEEKCGERNQEVLEKD